MTTGTSPQDFMKLLDATAADTEALLGKLLADATLPGEIAGRDGGARIEAHLHSEQRRAFDMRLERTA